MTLIYHKIYKIDKDQDNALVENFENQQNIEEYVQQVIEKHRSKYEREYKFIDNELTAKTYVANIDFGSKNGREHYHAIVFPIGSSIDLKAWSYGRINAERIHPSDNDIARTTKYIAKLTSHAIKDTTGHAYRIIYSR